MVPHSHDDVGWKETVDEYYSQGRIQIKKIYDSVIRALVRKENRRFVCFKVKNPLFFLLLLWLEIINNVVFLDKTTYVFIDLFFASTETKN